MLQLIRLLSAYAEDHGFTRGFCAVRLWRRMRKLPSCVWGCGADNPPRAGRYSAQGGSALAEGTTGLPRGVSIDEKISNSLQEIYDVPVMIGEFRGFGYKRIWEYYFSRIPTYDQAGKYSVTFKVEDGEGGEIITITVAKDNEIPYALYGPGQE